MELLLVIMFFVLMFGLTLPVSLRFYRNYVADDAAETLKSVLRRAHAYAAAERQGSGYGVKILPGRFVLFQGATYASRIASEDERIDYPASISVTGTSDEIRFSPLYATSSVSGTIDIVGGASQRTISINGAGKIETQ